MVMLARAHPPFNRSGEATMKFVSKSQAHNVSDSIIAAQHAVL